MNAKVLHAAARQQTGKGVNRRLRAEGHVPAVVYGVGTEGLLNVAVRPLDIVRVLKSAAGVNSLLELHIGDETGPTVMIKDYQIHPVTRTLLHVDLLAVAADKAVKVNVPVEYVGVSPLEKMGAKRRVLSRTVQVSCLPGDIPVTIPYEMATIKRPKVVYASELTLPENVAVAYKRDFAVISVRAKGAGAKTMVAEDA